MILSFLNETFCVHIHLGSGYTVYYFVIQQTFFAICIIADRTKYLELRSKMKHTPTRGSKVACWGGGLFFPFFSGASFCSSASAGSLLVENLRFYDRPAELESAFY